MMEETRTARLEVRLTEVEAERLRRASALHHMTVSDYIRKLLRLHDPGSCPECGRRYRSKKKKR